MNDKLSLNKGMLYENMIAQMITSMGKKLYFYTKYNKEKHRNDIEIDFLLSNESKTNLKVFPIEVKSSKNYSATSLDKFKDFKKDKELVAKALGISRATLYRKLEKYNIVSK